MSPRFKTAAAVAGGLLLWASAPALAGEAPVPSGARRGRISPHELSTQIDQISTQLKTAGDNLRVVETQFTERAALTAEQELARRFSDAEIQYLLGSWAQASVLFYDLVSDPGFQSGPHDADALFYLADCLRQQKNFIGAQLYWKQLLSMGPTTPHFKDGLARYLETAAQLGDDSGVEGYVESARTLGPLTPELTYVFGKWLFKRTDLSAADRLARAEEVFRELTVDPKGGFRLQAEYFLGVIAVQRAVLRVGAIQKLSAKDDERSAEQSGPDYGEAIERFKHLVAQTPASGPGGARDQKVLEMGNLSLGRLYFEAGRYDEALNQYQEIPRESDNFIDSLYEIAWVHVKKGEFQLAKNATDILLLTAPDSLLAPEAQLLQGHLLLKLGKYAAATETYGGVINTYAPVRDELDALLSVNKDPVSYFDKLLARSGKALDVATLLPPVALKWATTQKEVGSAVRIVNDLELSRRGVDDSQQIAQRILKALDERGLEAFPAIQEGYTRADAVDTAITSSEQALTGVEGYLVDDQLTAGERQALDRARAELATLQGRFESLPRDPTELLSRKKRMQARVDLADKDAFRLGYQLQSLSAQLTAIEKWVEDTRAERKNTPEEEKAFLEQLHQERAAIEGQAKMLAETRQSLAAERTSADAVISGEDQIRKQFAEQLSREHALIRAAEGRLGPEAARTLEKAHRARTRIEALRERTQAAKDNLRAQLERKGKTIRTKIANEQQLLSGDGLAVASISGEARGLVGRIAFDSFKRVRRQFYDLVLKADVGLVDVAFTRKQDKTSEIQKLSAQKDQELKALDDEFKEVLKDVD